MARNEGFYSSLPLNVAIERLKNAQVAGVSIGVKQTSNNHIKFHAELRNRSPIGLTMIYAHLQGTIQPTQNGEIHVAFRTRGLSRNIVFILTALGIAISVLLFMLFPSELGIIASMPAIAGMLFGIFWGMFSNGVHSSDQYKLRELVGRMLEKQSSMAIWQG